MDRPIPHFSFLQPRRSRAPALRATGVTRQPITLTDGTIQKSKPMQRATTTTTTTNIYLLPHLILGSGIEPLRTRATTTAISNAPPAPARSVATISHTAKRSRGSPSSRNVQAIPGTVSSAPRSNPWACPYCKWVQRNHRTPDLKRHIRTHTRFQRPAQWVCCGVSLKDAGRYTLPAGAEPYNWQGEMMIGGCGKEFSRRDALKRHLDNNHITCIGDLNAFATSND
ncbi:hypothetical protein F5141DRAFT_708442 [Pisolithus sp. B1]|nr:hypothetical protein F5141DRAFT_708442 [Pisolithus sp. B1]